MNRQLQAMVSDEERAWAAQLGTATDKSLDEKLQELFVNLEDPLLSAQDAADLLGLEAQLTNVKAALLAQVSEGVLDVSTQTLRPLDPPGTELFRYAANSIERLKIIALQAELPNGDTRLQFSLDGRLVRSIAKVDRLDAISGEGNQRQEIEKHVTKIAEGIEAGTQVPNALLLVMLEESTVEEGEEEKFPASFTIIRPLQDYVDIHRSGSATSLVQRVRLVEIDFPFRLAAFDEEKSTLLVDGQQRTAALSLVSVDSVPRIDLAVIAVAASKEEAKRVFQVANDTVKIATEFSRALLAAMGETAPGYLKAERVRAEAVKNLAITSTTSPFHGLVRYPGTRMGSPIIAYNSLYLVVGIFNESVLKSFNDDADDLAAGVSRAFTIVKKVWPDAWGLRPAESRLMHGAGLRAMATLIVRKLESRLEGGRDADTDEAWAEIEKSLERLRPRVVWTDAEAAAGSALAKKYWREEISNRQNTSQDIAALTSFLRKESLDLDAQAKKAVRSV